MIDREGNNYIKHTQAKIKAAGDEHQLRSIQNAYHESEKGT